MHPVLVLQVEQEQEQDPSALADAGERVNSEGNLLLVNEVPELGVLQSANRAHSGESASHFPVLQLRHPSPREAERRVLPVLH